MATNWLDTIPAIPLARGVPAVLTEDYIPKGAKLMLPRGTAVVVLSRKPHLGAVKVEARGKVFRIHTSKLRIALGDPAGFGYALRCWAQRDTGNRDGRHVLMWWRHVKGEATDADRLALAQALEEVTSTA